MTLSAHAVNFNGSYENDANTMFIEGKNLVLQKVMLVNMKAFLLRLRIQIFLPIEINKMTVWYQAA